MLIIAYNLQCKRKEDRSGKFVVPGLGSPIPQIKEVITDSTAGEFSDGGQDAFELVPPNPFHHSADEFFLETGFDTFFRAIALVDKQI